MAGSQGERRHPRTRASADTGAAGFHCKVCVYVFLFICVYLLIFVGLLWFPM